MPKLILSVDNKVIDEFSIDKDTVTIGRRTDNDICLDNLAISGYHSQITTVLNDSFLEDLNSTNGTFVNSKIVKKHALKDGDIIDIGNHRIKYINHLASSSANSDFEKTVVMTPNNNQKHLEESIADLEKEIDALTNTKDEPNDNSSDEKANEGPLALIDAIYEHEEKAEKEASLKQSAAEKSSQVESVSKEQSVEKPSQEEPESKQETVEIPSSEDSASTKSQPLESDKDKLGRIQILSGSNCGKELVLDKSLTTLGKPDVAVVGITKRNSGYFVVHIDGSEDRPSKLNGEVIKGKAEPLEDHDIIDVAGIKLEFFVE